MHAAPFKGNIIATNLPHDFTGERLAELFEGFGMVIGAEIRYIQTVSGRAPIGVVALAPDSAVEAAIEAVNLSMVGDRQIKVGRAKQRPQKPRPDGVSGKAARTPQKTAFPAAEPLAQPRKTVVVEYKPRRRLISNA